MHRSPVPEMGLSTASPDRTLGTATMLRTWLTCLAICNSTARTGSKFKEVHSSAEEAAATAEEMAGRTFTFALLLVAVTAASAAQLPFNTASLITGMFEFNSQTGPDSRIIYVGRNKLLQVCWTYFSRSSSGMQAVCTSAMLVLEN